MMTYNIIIDPEIITFKLDFEYKNNWSNNHRNITNNNVVKLKLVDITMNVI